MPCENRLKELLGVYSQGLLPKEKAESVKKHLAECPECVSDVEQIQALLPGMQELAEEHVPAELLVNYAHKLTSTPFGQFAEWSVENVAEHLDICDSCSDELQKIKTVEVQGARPVPTERPVWMRLFPSRKLWYATAAAAAIVLIVALPNFFVRSQGPVIAVLPFEYIGPSGMEYYGSAISNEIASNLAKVSALSVISRTSVLQYKNSGKKLLEIAEELGVNYVLEGTVSIFQHKGVQRIRINPKLVRVENEKYVWTETFEHSPDQIFALQSGVTQNVISALQINLLEAEHQILETKPTENLEAYEYYLKGNEYYNQNYSIRDLRIAVEMYQKAVEADPNFALAYTKLSMAHTEMYWNYYDRTDERLDKSKQAVTKAVQLNPDLPEAHLALGLYYYHGKLDYEQALYEFTIAQKNQPNNSDLVAAVGFVQRRQGKFEQAIISLKKALKLDPRSIEKTLNLGNSYYVLRNYPEAERYWNLVISLAPDYSVPYVLKALLYLNWKGDTEKAGMVLREGVERIGLSEFMLPLGYHIRRIFFRIPGTPYLKELERLTFESFGSDTSGYFLFKAELSGLLKHPELKAAYYDSARKILENKIMLQPEEFRLHNALGIAYAGLGRKEEAIREGKRGVELLPVTKDPHGGGPQSLENFARIYVMVGEYDAAVAQLEYLTSIPSWISVTSLRNDPTWAPLHNHPRFQKLINERV